VIESALFAGRSRQDAGPQPRERRLRDPYNCAWEEAFAGYVAIDERTRSSGAFGGSRPIPGSSRH